MSKALRTAFPLLWITLYPIVAFLYVTNGLSGLVGQIVSNAAVLISAGGLIFTLFSFGVELRLSRAARHTDLMLKFEERFEGDEMKAKRQAASKFLLEHRLDTPVEDPKWHEVDDVLDFFEVIGTLVKQGDEDPTLAYSFFHYWLSHYWLSCRSYVEAIQQAAPVQWEEATWLFEKLHKIELEKNKGKHANPTPEELALFFKEETELKIA